MRQALKLYNGEGSTGAMDNALTTFKDRDKIVCLDDWQKIARQYSTVDAEKT